MLEILHHPNMHYDHTEVKIFAHKTCEKPVKRKRISSSLTVPLVYTSEIICQLNFVFLQTKQSATLWKKY